MNPGADNERMGAVISFPLPLPGADWPPERWARIWAAADELWPEYERGLDASRPHRPVLRVVRAPGG